MFNHSLKSFGTNNLRDAFLPCVNGLNTVQNIAVASTPSFDQVVIGSVGTNATSAVRYDQLMSVVGGLDCQDSFKDKNLIAPPGGESIGDRYIVATSATIISVITITA